MTIGLRLVRGQRRRMERPPLQDPQPDRGAPFLDPAAASGRPETVGGCQARRLRPCHVCRTLCRFEDLGESLYANAA